MNITQILSSDQLSLLRTLFPVSGLIHIGAGTGSVTSVYQKWRIPNAVLIEADPHLFSQLESKTAGIEGWFSLQAVVSDQAAQASFYQSNNPHEHGLIEPEKLTAFWRNLKTVEVQTADTQTLANILPGTGVSNPDNSPYNWLIVDCLPAAHILEGIGNYLGQVDVVIARAVLNPDDDLPSAGKTRVDELLRLHGYQGIQVYEENHPAVGQTLYVRDHKVNLRKQREQLADLQQAKTEAEQNSQALATQAQQLTHDCNQQAQLASERQQQLETVQQQLADLQQAKTEAEQNSQALATQAQQLTHDRNQQAQLASERQQQLETVQQQLADLQQAKTEVDDLSAQQQNQLAELQAHKQQLEATHAETVYHYNLLQNEFAKAEAQIELIQEMLRRELEEQ